MSDKIGANVKASKIGSRTNPVVSGSIAGRKVVSYGVTANNRSHGEYAYSAFIIDENKLGKKNSRFFSGTAPGNVHEAFKAAIEAIERELKEYD